MVPAAYVRLDALPLTANGKLDRQALPAPEMSDVAARGYEPPRGETEERLARIWADLLGLERVGRRDNFFDLGGRSLLAIRLLSKIRPSFKTDLPLSTVFHSPTIAALAQSLNKRGAPSEWFSLIPIQQGGSRPPLFGVEIVGVEFFRLIGADQPVYNFRFGAGSPAGSILELPMIEALAAHYIEELRTVQPNGPYFLIGYSWGGLVAYEIAQQLTASGEIVELVALVDTLLPNSYGQSFGDRAVRIISYSPSKFFQRLKYKLTTKLNKESIKYKLTLAFKKWIHGATYYRPDSFDVETIYTVMRAYRRTAYSGKVIFFKAMENPTLPEGFHAASEIQWKGLVGQGLEIEQVSCDHATIMKGRNVAQIVDKIRAAMDRAIDCEQRTKDEVRATPGLSVDIDSPRLV
jgi:thioesterase domain-containing protein